MSRIAAIFFVLLLIAPAASAQSAEDLFQQAIRTERLSGNMEAAIALYEQIVRDHPDERELSARALLQMAKGYETLGRDEARRAYATLVSDYSDYPAMVSEARAGYARLSEEPEVADTGTIIQRETPKGGDSWGASLSPDGRYLIAPLYSDKRGVIIQDLETGEYEVLDPDMDEGPRGGAEFAALSPDGKTVAAGWYPSGSTSWATLRTVDVKSGEVTEVLNAFDYWKDRHGLTLLNANIQAHQWTADGESILAFFSSGTDEDEDPDFWHEELALIHLDGTPPTIVAEIGDDESYGWQKTCITSDERFVFAEFNDGDREGRPSFIARYDLESGDRAVWRQSSAFAITLVGCPTNPDRVLYAENLIGGKRLVSAPASGDGEPVLHAMLPEDSYFGLASSKGDVIYWPQQEERTLWSATLDPDRFDLAGSPVRMTVPQMRGVGITDWSPDGHTIVWRDGPEPVLWNAETDEMRRISVPGLDSTISMIFPSAFSADGSVLKVTAGDQTLYLDSDTFSVIHARSFYFSELGLTWSRGNDHAGVEYARREEDDCLVAVDMTTRETSTVACLEAEDGLQFFNYNLSPDHTKAWVARRGETYQDLQIQVVDLATGASRVVFERNSSSAGDRILGFPEWIGNDALLITARPAHSGFNNITELYELDVATGELRPILQGLVDMLKFRYLKVSPDRRYVLGWGTPRRIGEDQQKATVIRRVVDLSGE